jgi:hypothetical protein
MNLSGTLLAGIFAFCTALFWGTYGPLLSRGHHLMGTEGRLRPFICVGVAYLLVAIVGPIVVMYMTGIDKGDGLFSGWTFSGIVWSTIVGTVGALGAFTLIMALGAGGPASPVYVMPIVFGCAPVVSAFTSMYLSNTYKISPFFAAGLILVAVGAVTILITAPRPQKKPADDSHTSQPAAAKPFAVKATKESSVDEDPAQIRAATLSALASRPDSGEPATQPDTPPEDSQPNDSTSESKPA